MKTEFKFNFSPEKEIVVNRAIKDIAKKSDMLVLTTNFKNNAPVYVTVYPNSVLDSYVIIGTNAVDLDNLKISKDLYTQLTLVKNEITSYLSEL